MRMRLVPPGTDPLTVPVEYKERKIPWLYIGCALFVLIVGYGLTNRSKAAKAQALEVTATITSTATPTPTMLHPGMATPEQTPTGYLSALWGNVATTGTPRANSGGGFTLPTLPPVRVEVTRIVGLQVTRVVQQTVVVVQTQIITATPAPTNTPEPTQTPWIIIVTATPTETPTPTMTASPTETAMVPGETETPTPTPTMTATPTETLAAYP